MIGPLTLGAPVLVQFSFVVPPQHCLKKKFPWSSHVGSGDRPGALQSTLLSWAQDHLSASVAVRF
jgi:hypothetical protein